MDTEPPLIFIGDSIYYTQNSIHHLLWTYKLACFPTWCLIKLLTLISLTTVNARVVC